MGRKIPGKKHRGVKDPYKQQEERLNKIKNKLNSAPASIDTQEIPRRLQDIARFNDVKGKGVTNGPFKKKKVKKMRQEKTLIDGRKYVDHEREMRGMTRPTKLVPLLQQHPKETYKKFLKRVDRVTGDMMKEAAFENKFKVEVQRNELGQVVSVLHQEKIDPLLSDKQRKELAARSEKKKAARRERDRRRRGKKRQNDDDQEEEEDEFSCYKDKIEFGEVVYEPPSLDTSKLTKKWEKKPKSFLFMEKLKSNQEVGASTTSPLNKPNTKKAKKEQLSAGRRRILEDERQRVVEAYRNMKAARQGNPQNTG